MTQDPAPRRIKSKHSLTTLVVFGVPVRLHFTFLLLPLFPIAAGIGSSEPALSDAIYVVALVGSVLLHELAHAVVARAFGIRTAEVVMFPVGGVSRLTATPGRGQEFWIAIAGPAVNLGLGGALFGLLAARHALTSFASLAVPADSNLLQRLAVANLTLGAFNLLPAFPMDGGRVLRSALAHFQSGERAVASTAWAGRILAFGLAGYGLVTAMYPLVFAAFFIYLGVAQENAEVMGRRLTHGIPVRAAMVTDYRVLSHGNTIRDAANLLLATSQQDFPVVHGEQVLGLLSRSALLRAMAAEGPGAYVAGVMDREYARLSPDIDLAAVLPAMTKTGSCALVMQGERLVGLLTSESLAQFVLLRRFGMDAGEARA